MKKSVIGALGFEYGFYNAPLLTDDTIKLTAVLPKIHDILQATESPFDLLVLDPEELVPGDTQNKKYLDLWKSKQGLFGLFALRELIQDGHVPTDKLQVVSTSSQIALEILSKSAGLVIPQESIAYIEINDQETIIQSIIQSRLGMLAK